MASLASRVSSLWEANVTRNAMEDDIEQQEQDGRTPLDKTIDRIGMGASFPCAFDQSNFRGTEPKLQEITNGLYWHFAGLVSIRRHAIY